MRKKALALLMAGAAVLGTAGCSYMEFETSLRSTLKGEEGRESDYVNEASLNTESAENTDSDNEKEKNVYYVGDTIKSAFEYPDESGNIISEDEVWYTLNKVDIVRDITELGISMDDFSNSFSNEDRISDDGKVQEGYSFVAANVTIKNIDIDFDVESSHNMYINDYAGTKSGILDPTGPVMLECAYFSGHDEDKVKNYYAFSLDVGQEGDYTVGWVVPDGMLEEPFYYVIGTAYSAEYYQYFLLNGSEGDSQ